MKEKEDSVSRDDAEITQHYNELLLVVSSEYPSTPSTLASNG